MALLLVLSVCLLANGASGLAPVSAELHEESLVAEFVELVQKDKPDSVVVVVHDYDILPKPFETMLSKLNRDQNIVTPLRWTPATPEPPPNTGQGNFEYWFSWMTRASQKNLANHVLTVMLFRDVNLKRMIEHVFSVVAIHPATDRFLFWSRDGNTTGALLHPRADVFLYLMGCQYDTSSRSIRVLHNCHYCDSGNPKVIQVGEFVPYHGLIPSDLLLYPDYTRNLHGKYLNGSFPLDVTPSEMKYMHESFLPIFPFCWIYYDVGERINFNWHMDMTPIVEGEDIEFEQPDGNWTGSTGLVLQKTVDFAGAPTSARKLQVIDCVYPHVFTYMAFLNRTPRPLWSWKALMQPYTPGMWGLIFLSAVFGSIAFYTMLKLHSYMESPFPSQPPTHLSLYSTRYIFSAVIEENPNLIPTASGARVFLIFWWLYADVIVCGFEAKFIGFLVAPEMELLPMDYKEMVQWPGWRWGCINFVKPFVDGMVADSVLPEHQPLLKKMEDGGDMLRCMIRTVTEDFSCMGLTEILLAMKFTHIDLMGNFPAEEVEKTTIFVQGAMTLAKNSMITPISWRIALYSNAAGLHEEYRVLFENACGIMGLKEARKTRRIYEYSMKLQFSQMKGPFVMLVILLSASTLSFLAEVVSFRNRKRPDSAD